MSQAVHRHLDGIEPDGGDDLVDLAMTVLFPIVIPRAAVVLQKQRRIVDAAIDRRFQPGCQLPLRFFFAGFVFGLFAPGQRELSSAPIHAASATSGSCRRK